MKTMISKLFVAFFAIGLLFSSCAKEDKDCSTLGVDKAEAHASYNADPTPDNCDAYKAALQAMVTADCQDTAAFQAVIDGMNCR